MAQSTPTSPLLSAITGEPLDWAELFGPDLSPPRDFEPLGFSLAEPSLPEESGSVQPTRAATPAPAQPKGSPEPASDPLQQMGSEDPFNNGALPFSDPFEIPSFFEGLPSDFPEGSEDAQPAWVQEAEARAAAHLAEFAAPPAANAEALSINEPPAAGRASEGDESEGAAPIPEVSAPLTDDEIEALLDQCLIDLPSAASPPVPAPASVPEPTPAPPSMGQWAPGQQQQHHQYQHRYQQQQQQQHQNQHQHQQVQVPFAGPSFFPAPAPIIRAPERPVSVIYTGHAPNCIGNCLGACGALPTVINQGTTPPAESRTLRSCFPAALPQQPPPTNFFPRPAAGFPLFPQQPAAPYMRAAAVPGHNIFAQPLQRGPASSPQQNTPSSSPHGRKGVAWSGPGLRIVPRPAGVPHEVPEAPSKRGRGRPAGVRNGEGTGRKAQIRREALGRMSRQEWILWKKQGGKKKAPLGGGADGGPAAAA